MGFTFSTANQDEMNRQRPIIEPNISPTLFVPKGIVSTPVRISFPFLKIA